MTYKSGSIVDDQDYDSLIDKYNTAFASTGGIGIPKKAEGEIVTRNDWFNLWQKVFDTAVAQNRVVTIPFHSSAPGENPFSDAVARNYGYLISALPTWGAVGDPPADVTVNWSPASASGREPSPGASGGGGGISQDYTTPGTFSFTVPDYTTLHVEVSGAGGGGTATPLTSYISWPGGPGGASNFLGVIAYGGLAGDKTNGGNPLDSGYVPPSVPAGAPSTGVGGDENIPGGGGAGGTGSGYSYYEDNQLQGSYSSGSGSAGGKAIKTWTAGSAGAPTPGQVVVVNVGDSGHGGRDDVPPSYYGNDPQFKDTVGGLPGTAGSVKISGTLRSTSTPAGTSVITFKAVLDKASAKTVTVNYATSDIAGGGGGAFSQEYLTPGTFTYNLPSYSLLTVEVIGAGGGAGFIGNASNVQGGLPPKAGQTGGNSSFAGVVTANGGPGGKTNGAGDPGTATGGDTNSTGGGALGAAGMPASSSGNGDVTITTPTYYPGGRGGKAIKTWTSGGPAPGPVTVVVGKAGYGANYEDYDTYILTITDQSQKDFYNSAALKMLGANGSVRISGSSGVAGAVASATAGLDYTPTSGTLTFAPGETYKEVNVPILYDTIQEPDEQFQIVMSSPVNAKIGTGTAIGTILGVTVVPPTVDPPPPPPPADTTPGEWQGYYLPRPDLPGSGRFYGQQYFEWKATAFEPTPPADRPFPYGFTSQGEYCQSDGNCQGGSQCPCNGLMSYGNPYQGDPVLTCFPGKNC